MRRAFGRQTQLSDVTSGTTRESPLPSSTSTTDAASKPQLYGAEKLSSESVSQALVSERERARDFGRRSSAAFRVHAAAAPSKQPKRLLHARRQTSRPPLSRLNSPSTKKPSARIEMRSKHSNCKRRFVDEMMKHARALNAAHNNFSSRRLRRLCRRRIVISRRGARGRDARMLASVRLSTLCFYSTASSLQVVFDAESATI